MKETFIIGGCMRATERVAPTAVGSPFSVKDDIHSQRYGIIRSLSLVFYTIPVPHPLI